MTITKSSAKHGHRVRQTTGGKDLVFGTIEPSNPKKKRKSKRRKSQNGTTDHIPSPEKQLAMYGMVAPHREIPKKAKKSSASPSKKSKPRVDSAEMRWRAAARRAASEAQAAQDRLRGTEGLRTSMERELAKSSMAAYQPEELPDHLKHKTKKKDWFE